MAEQPAEVTRTPRQVVAYMCGITERRVEQLVREGVLPTPARRGEHDVIECVRAFVEWREKERSVYTSKELAELLGIAEPNIHKYKDAGMPQLERGRWHMPESVRWIIRRERDMRHKHGGKGLDTRSAEELADEKLRAAREDRMLKQLQREEKERILIRRDECEQGWKLLGGLVAAALEALPGRLAGPVAATDTVLEARRVLFDEARRIRAELARSLQMLTDAAAAPAAGPAHKTGRKPGGKNNPKTRTRVQAKTNGRRANAA